MRSIVLKLTGSAPVCSTRASCFASETLPMLLISAPVPRGSIPDGFWLGLIAGQERIWSSSTIANAQSAPQFEPCPAIWPRSASFFVTCRNVELPLLLKDSVTIGKLVAGSKSCRTPDSFSSDPVMFGYLPSVA